MSTTDSKPVGALDRQEAAAYLSVSLRMVDKYASAGDLPRCKIGTKTVFRVADLDKFLKSRLVKAAKQ